MIFFFSFLKNTIKKQVLITTEVSKLDIICPIGITVCFASEVRGGNSVLNNIRNKKKRIIPKITESIREITK